MVENMREITMKTTDKHGNLFIFNPPPINGGQCEGNYNENY